MKSIAIFASGSGTNAENISQYFEHNNQINIDLILTNNPNAFVLNRAVKMGVKSLVFNREDFYRTTRVLNELLIQKVDLIVLAGFLWLVPPQIVTAYNNRIINIHPALLPKYGGKGMYGDFVHQAVSKAREEKTGITIHYVNNHYDEGDVIFQKSVQIKPGEEPDLIAQKVHALEYEYFPKVIEDVLTKF